MNKAQVTKHLLNKTFLTNTFSTTESNSQLPLWTEQNQAGRPCRTRPPDVGSENKPAVSKWLFFIYSGFILMSFKELLFLKKKTGTFFSRSFGELEKMCVHDENMMFFCVTTTLRRRSAWSRSARRRTPRRGRGSWLTPEERHIL